MNHCCDSVVGPSAKGESLLSNHRVLREPLTLISTGALSDEYQYKPVGLHLGNHDFIGHECSRFQLSGLVEPLHYR